MKRFTVIYEFQNRRWSTSIEHWNIEADAPRVRGRKPGQAIVEIYED